MGFRRNLHDHEPPRGDALTAAMAGIGMRFAAKPSIEPQIEQTLVAASEEGLERNDLRVLAMLVTWLGVHARLVNADLLYRLLESHASPRVRAFWAAFASGQKDRRFARVARLYDDPQVDLLSVGAELHIARRGEDPRFADGPLRVPGGVLRDRPADVLSPSELASQHRAYRARLMMGPSYRADMWAALEREPGLSAAELARRTLGSFATAWQVKRDWEVVRHAP